MTVTAPKTASRRRTVTKSEPRLVRRFKEWLVTRDEADQLADRKDVLRQRLLDELAEHSETYTDEKGNVWYDLPVPVTFKNRQGKVFKFSSLKRERRLSPAQPQPEEDKAIAVLKKKKLWLTADQEKVIQELQIACPFAVVSVDLDRNAFAAAVFKKQITPDQYESTLQEQKEFSAFIPVEG